MPKPHGAARETVLSVKQGKLIFTKPDLILFGYQVVPGSHGISLQEMSLFHTRVERTLSEVIWLARAHSAGITVWQDFRVMSLPFGSLNSLEKVCFVLKHSL